MQTEKDPVSDLYPLDICIEDCSGYSSGPDSSEAEYGNEVSTRGDAVSISPDIAGNVFIAVYDGSGRLETTGYWDGIGSDMTLLVDRSCSHTVLAYGNFGDRSALQQISLDDALQEEYLFSWDKLQAGGCPMVARASLSKGASDLALRLERILAKVTFRLDSNFPEGMLFSFDRVSVMNTNSRVSLFGSSAAQSADDIISGDYTVTLSDPMVFYLPEISREACFLPTRIHTEKTGMNLCLPEQILTCARIWMLSWISRTHTGCPGKGGSASISVGTMSATLM
ncbi:MAG: hypothetical protein ACI4AE_03100 [Candidatus Cryptobacteroides sp.]